MPLRRADDSVYVLAANASATGTAKQISGGEYHFMVEGTAGGATIALQIQSPNGTWMPVQVFSGSVVSFTTLPGNQSAIDLPNCSVRMSASGGSPSGLFAYLIGLG